MPSNELTVRILGIGGLVIIAGSSDAGGQIEFSASPANSRGSFRTFYAYNSRENFGWRL